jgi:hypothetical protein
VYPDFFDDYQDPNISHFRWNHGTVARYRRPTFTLFERPTTPLISPDFLKCTFQVRFWCRGMRNYVVYTHQQYQEAAEDIMVFLMTGNFELIKESRQGKTAIAKRREDDLTVEWLVPLRQYLIEGKQHEEPGTDCRGAGALQAPVSPMETTRFLRLGRRHRPILRAAQ